VGNEENEYPVPDPTRTMLNITNDSVTSTKKSLKVEIMDKITEKLIEKMQHTVKQNVEDELKKYKAQKVKNLRRHRNN
jgi:hypothetical protein